MSTERTCSGVYPRSFRIPASSPCFIPSFLPATAVLLDELRADVSRRACIYTPAERVHTSASHVKERGEGAPHKTTLKVLGYLRESA